MRWSLDTFDRKEREARSQQVKEETIAAFAEEYPESAKAEGLVSVLSAPLSVGGKVIGLIRVYSSEEREFTDDEDSFMMAVAAISAVAIENARLHDALRNNYELMAKHAYSVYED